MAITAEWGGGRVADFCKADDAPWSLQPALVLCEEHNLISAPRARGAA